MGAVLVTGGAGYVGSHAARALTRSGYDVVIYDNLSAGHRQAVGNATLIEGDIRDAPAVERALTQCGIEAVLHFAGLLAVADSLRDPSGYYHTNVVGTLAVLEAMVRASVKRFVFSSTCAVYGEPKEMPLYESHATQPINAYGETKRAVELALPHFDRAYGLKAIALRYFNAAGADPDGDLGEDHDPEIHLIPRAIEAVRGGPPLYVFGEDYPTPDGTCIRDYIHVSDLADAHVRALRALETGSASAIYNLGTGRGHSVREVIGAVERVSGARVPLVLAPRRPGDPPVLFASSEKAQRELGWRPCHADLETIVKTAWRWHTSHPRGYGAVAS